MLSEIGLNIKRNRLEKELTIRDASKSIGISPSLLSQIENGKVSPSLKTLALISNSFSLRPTDLLGSNNTLTQKGILKRENRRKWQNNEENVLYELLNPTLYNVRIEVTKLKIDKNGFVPSHFVVGGEEFFLILKGKVEFTLGETVFIMDEGDTIQYDASIRHKVKNISDSESEILWISTPPSF